ncbi:hypothetical protein [Kocuria rosea]|uniref:hypothetical protein n=1 Tax=Kocuria rosea TaxID=1275 RepID=UPI000A410E2F|nr:hypothetical protein [Kocuria polaris]
MVASARAGTALGGQDEPSQSAELFFDDVVRQYVDAPGFVHRAWLEAAVQERLELPDCRYVVIVGEPGAGKSGLMASLGARHPEWLRYFIRRDSTTPLSGGDAVSFLLRVGHQLATRRPELFDPKRLEIVVNQRVTVAGAGASVTGVRIEDLTVSPFHRTAIRVDQHVADLEGSLIGLDVARATVEPRLLLEENLQFLALLDPAAALAAATPDARIVVLVDAVDEALRFRGGSSVLDWLERSPELPHNLRVILTSRPHARLSALQGVRPGSLELIDLESAGEAIEADTRTFATGVLSAPEIAERVDDPKQVEASIVTASEGNFAYLRAWERTLVSAVADGNDTLADRLLGLEVLPTGLGALYAVFLNNTRAEIEQLGALDIEYPRSPQDEVTPAWEGAGQRVIAVLAVAYAPLAVQQLMRLGAIRVWPSSMDSVMQRLRPLLDRDERGWRFFHPSVSEYLTGDAESEAPHLFVPAPEWHRRVVRAYQGAASLSEVDWTAVDDYGLLHVADHLADLGADGHRQIIELVNGHLRAAVRGRFLTDLPFQGIVDTALANIDYRQAPADVLADEIFLAIVRADLGTGAARLAPAVFGLMARSGRFAEAQARIGLLAPSEHRFAAMQALITCTPASERHLLGPHDGAELLVSAAQEVPVTDQTLFPGVRHREAVEEAAVALAPHDLERALELAAEAEPEWDPDRVHDRVLLTAVRAMPAAGGAVLVDRMAGGRAAAAAELAPVVDEPEHERLLALAAGDIAQGRAKPAIVALARLISAVRPTSRQRADSFATDLCAAAADLEVEKRDVLLAAEIVAKVDPHLADVLLDRIASADAAGSWEKTKAVRLWAVMGLPEKARALAESILEYERGLGWYGPADAIAELAVALDAIDVAWARSLADEAEGLIVAAAEANTDSYESRINSTLGMTAQAFRTWDPPRALRLARRMDHTWISGSPWDSFGGRLSALACLGIDASDTDPALARALLDECMPSQEPDSVLGRSDARVVRGGLFRPDEEAGDTASSLSRTVHFMTYLANCVNYWHGARERLPFFEPADVARCMQMAPGVSGSTASWASAVAAAVQPLAVVDLDAAVSITGWVADPAERLVAVAGLVGALSSADDQREADALAAVGRSAVALPRYTAELDLTKVDQAPFLRYLDPAARARFEAALLLPMEQDTLAESLVIATDSWYLTATLHAQKLLDAIWAAATHQDGDEVLSYVRSVVAELDSVPDPIQQDLVRLAALWAVAPWDAGLASEITTGIQHPGRAYLARLYLTAGSNVAAANSTAVREVLDNPPADLQPIHRIMAVTSAMAWLGEECAGELTDQGVVLLGDADAWSATAGLLMLADAAPSDRRADLVRAARDRAAGIANTYLRSDLVADLLAAAAETGDVELVVSIARRQLEDDWQLLMEGLRRGAEPLLSLGGPGIFARLDQAFRAAQTVIGPSNDSQHLDGVAAVEARNFVSLSSSDAPMQSYDGDLRALYLRSDDLPGMQLVQDSADSGPDSGDYAYSACNGLGTGLRVWLGATTDPVWRLVDIRFVFPDADRAAAYHAERFVANSEGYPPVPDAPSIGEDCRVFGGTNRLPGVDIEMTNYFYVLRVGAVVVKLFVAEGPESTASLEVGQVHAIAKLVVARLNATSA